MGCRTELRDTEAEHKKAMAELEEMRETMERMELERAEMVAEVEAQIERALASMAVDIDDSDYGSERPLSRLSSRPGSRLSSRAQSPLSPRSSGRHLRSFPTESTLAEHYGESASDMRNSVSPIREDGEDEEEANAQAAREKAKRFSLTKDELGMQAVDEGIALKSEGIAKKVLEIQQKVCTA